MSHPGALLDRGVGTYRASAEAGTHAEEHEWIEFEPVQPAIRRAVQLFGVGRDHHGVVARGRLVAVPTDTVRLPASDDLDF
jgi:hypothetical protein